MRFLNILKKCAELIGDSVFPRRCVVCDRVLKTTEQGICHECTDKVHIIKAPYCMKCGKQLKNDEEVYCSDCKITYHYYDEGRSLFLYDDAMKRSIYRFKYNGRGEYADYYSKQLSIFFGDYLKRLMPFAFVPIPIHRKRLKKRGYNQASLIAHSLGKRLNIPVLDDFLARNDETVKQKKLNVFERQNNLKKAFKTMRNDVKLSTAVLIDDIYTTGATIDAAAACLKKAGVDNVYFICVCSGRNT